MKGTSQRVAQVERAARKVLENSLMLFRGEPVGTVAARDVRAEPLNYHHCFTRDFFVSALVFLIEGRVEIVRNCLALLVDLHSRDHSMDCLRPGFGLMPASFVVRVVDGEERLIADFGERAIARVTPVDSGFWWLLLLLAYTRVSGDRSLASSAPFQQTIHRTLELSLEAGYEMLPTLLVPDGAFMIDRRMGVGGHPLEVQALFYGGLRAARELLPPDDRYQAPVAQRLGQLLHHVRRDYWIDAQQLDRINRFPVEEFGASVENHFNIQPDTIPAWLPPWLPDGGGYLAGNLGPGRMDFRFFSLGNLLAVVTSLASPGQSRAIMDLVEARWEQLVGRMPMKICYPAVEGCEWEVLTGRDPKNRPWSYHNGGSWPCLLWILAAAARHTARPHLITAALDIAAGRIAKDDWPEYYDTPSGRLTGRQARLRQTWSAAGFLAALEILRDGKTVAMLVHDEEPELRSCGEADLVRGRPDPTQHS